MRQRLGGNVVIETENWLISMLSSCGFIVDSLALILFVRDFLLSRIRHHVFIFIFLFSFCPLRSLGYAQIFRKVLNQGGI